MLTWYREGDRLTALVGGNPIGTVEPGWKGVWNWTFDLCGTRRGHSVSEFSAQVEVATKFADWIQSAGLQWVK